MAVTRIGKMEGRQYMSICLSMVHMLCCKCDFPIVSLLASGGLTLVSATTHPVTLGTEVPFLYSFTREWKA